MTETHPNRRNGKPCYVGTRITPQDVAEYLNGGMSVDAVLSDFPELNREQVEAARELAKEAKQCN